MSAVMGIDQAKSAAVPGWLDKERTIAGPGYNRWLVPPSALAIHLCIGMAYGFSVFWLPLSKAMGANTPAECKAATGLADQLFTTACNWQVSTLGLLFSVMIVVLGAAAALWGGWLERAGPRKAGVAAAICWAGGMAVMALGSGMHQLWIMALGALVGGIGLGIGYISPVSTLIKWFPDRRGLATGMAIMGFGGGAMIGAPLAAEMMKRFSTATDPGVSATLLALAAIYFVFMMGGALGYRLPAADWAPAGWTPKPAVDHSLITQRHVHVKNVWRIPQFWLVWMVLCMNVSAGIGVLAMASPMLQEIFGGQLIGVPQHFSQLDKTQLASIAGIAAGFAALLSLFNIVGRFFWASLSDLLGRKLTYTVFFVLGGVMYYSAPHTAATGALALFVGAFCIILSMYGGGFATVPAYLADLFGTQMVGAIHGRLLTAWSVAGVIGPVLVTQLRDHELGLGLPREQAYDATMYILIGLLAIGLVCNLAVRPLAAKRFMSDAELAEEKRLAHERAAGAQAAAGAPAASSAPSSPLALVLAWAVVGIPLAWGLFRTLQSVAKFFH